MLRVWPDTAARMRAIVEDGRSSEFLGPKQRTDRMSIGGYCREARSTWRCASWLRPAPAASDRALVRAVERLLEGGARNPVRP
jgi:hypothetical protein